MNKLNEHYIQFKGIRTLPFFFKSVYSRYFDIYKNSCPESAFIRK